MSFSGLIHSSGLVKRKSLTAVEDAKCVALLRATGAIPMALTNVSELCMWWESANNVHGRSNNPYDVNRIVGGSSGGEGCAQASACSAFGKSYILRIVCFLTFPRDNIFFELRNELFRFKIRR